MKNNIETTALKNKDGVMQTIALKAKSSFNSLKHLFFNSRIQVWI